MTLQEKIIDYYRAGYSQRSDSGDWTLPKYLPSKVRLPKTVRSDSFGFLPEIIAPPGDYETTSNKYGAVCVIVGDKKLGVKPGEFEILEMVENPARKPL